MTTEGSESAIPQENPLLFKRKSTLIDMSPVKIDVQSQDEQSQVDFKVVVD